MLVPFLFTLLFLAASAPLVVAPLRRPGASLALDDEKPAAGTYESTLLALRDLEFDHQLGVVTDDDYTRLHGQLLAQAAVALEKSEQRADEQMVTRIEAAVLERRAVRERRTASSGKSCEQTHRAAAPRFCSQCGQPLDAADRFCSGCGRALS